MSTELALFTTQDLMLMAEQVAKSRLFPGVDSSQSAFTLMMLCQSEGLHPIQAIKRYHIIKGRPSMRADAMQAEFQRRGGSILWHESTETACDATFRHALHAPEGVRLRTTMDELVKRGVAKEGDGIKLIYRQYPRQMLRARLISEGVRMVDPGIVVGIYTPEEIEDFEPRGKTSRQFARATETVVETTVSVEQESLADGHAEQVASAPTAEPAANDRADDYHGSPNEPISGGALYKWVLDTDPDRGLLKHLQDWGKLKKFPPMMKKWDIDQVSEGLKEAYAWLNRHKQPEPARETVPPENAGDAWEPPDAY